jgi:hypothetical protein
MVNEVKGTAAIAGNTAGLNPCFNGIWLMSTTSRR